ncbi:MAG: ASPIC/UnbV domain-containing protein [Verrucomicrobiales bacterium]
MSQSPASEADKVSSSYIEAWRDLATRIRDGASFSGHERNKAFLNCGAGTAFADVSAAVGLDVADDGRALAVADWDYDGDADLWTTNRSAPRIRYFENQSPSKPSHFVAVRLQGDPTNGCNRDAIGGRVEVLLKNAAAGRHVATLHAGDGFLSQSSKWLHFGLPAGAEIAAIEVHWPSGQPATTRYEAIASGSFYHLSQNGNATLWTPPARAQAINNPDNALADTQTGEPPIRVRLSKPASGPPISYLDADGKAQAVMKGPVLVKLFATWCPNCSAQFKALAQSAEAIRNAGLEILPICVDRLDPELHTTSDEVRTHLDKLGFKTAAGWADNDTVKSLDSLQSPLFYRQRPLPLPSSFLFDKQGALSVVYKGNFEVPRLLEDLKTLDAAPADAKMQSLPFPGRTTDRHFVTNPIEIAKVFHQGGYPDDARQYLIAWLSRNGAAPDKATAADNRRTADVHTLLGIITAQLGLRGEAIAAFESAIALAPELLPAHLELVSLYERDGALDQARDHLEAMLNTRANDPDVLTNLGAILEKQDQASAAAARYRQALDAQPRAIPALQKLASLLATSSEPDVRDAKAALALAKVLEQSPARMQLPILETIAAAYAAAGDIDAAIQRTRTALAIAQKSGNSNAVMLIQNKLNTYLAAKTD